MGLAHSLELAAVDKTKFGGLVGDSSIIKCNACKACKTLCLLQVFQLQ